MPDQPPRHPDILDDAKRRLRREAAARRRAAYDPAAPLRMRDAFLAGLCALPSGVVAGYWPIGDEIDVLPLLEGLAEAGRVVALPAVAGRGAPLVFRAWRPGSPLEAGDHGTRHPPASAPAVRPAVVLVPLLAFDAAGWRLGYGGGYYDRTLETLRRQGPVLAIGVGFAAQRVDSVPHGPHDQRMDGILTEEGLTEAAPGG